MHRLRPALLALAAGALALSAAGCAGKKPIPNIVWPLPPETPRIKFVNFFRIPEDIERGSWRKFTSVFVPRDPRAIITEPTGLALSVDESWLYVVSGSKGRVVRVDLAQGTMEVVAEPSGGQPRMPYAAAVDGDDNLYVTDRGENVVFVFAKGGKSFLRRIGQGVIEVPGPIAIDRRRQVMYVVCGATQKTQHRIEVFSLKGEHLRTIGRRGYDPGEFNFPSGLAVAPDGNLHVTDMLNFRVQVFSPEGELQTLFGQLGAGQPGTFDKAKGLAFDAFGNLYVADSAHAVQIFNSRYQPLMDFGGGVIQTAGPIAITSKNEIFVGDFVRAGVHHLRLVNTKAEDSVPESERRKPAPAPPSEPTEPARPPPDQAPAPAR